MYRGEELLKETGITWNGLINISEKKTSFANRYQWVLQTYFTSFNSIIHILTNIPIDLIRSDRSHGILDNVLIEDFGVPIGLYPSSVIKGKCILLFFYCNWSTIGMFQIICLKSPQLTSAGLKLKKLGFSSRMLSQSDAGVLPASHYSGP